MVGKKKLALILSGFLVMTGLISCSNTNIQEGNGSTSESSENAKNDGKMYTIGINQLVQHDALDASREGFVEGLKESGFEEGKNLKIDYQNAQGDMAIAKTISDQFVTSKVDMIFAIATSSLQASYNSTKDIPIVFTAVTDPIDAGVANSWESSETNVTGTSDMVSMEEQLDLLTELVPDIKTLGVLYNSSEANSLAQVQELKKEAKKRNIDIKEISVTTVNEINQNLSAALGSIDALYAPTDNTVASAYDLVGNLCINKNIPILCGEEAGVSKGGLCSIGIDYFKLGKEAGYKAAEILNGKAPSDIEISTLSDMSITINTDVVEKLNITVPDDINSKATKVTGGVN
ncbi:ABC transporter substrate-binding protein [Clostridium sp. 1001271B_151109_B4]|uniref:ABC transporter substrate-binding protein n=1 Tax=Clostridium sp. 1001271B_151109_B4 TaxID=2787148 RepID=UPI0018AC8878|nr:ABC transporter substrate-binding protein [Clostridium sp. 1001271B_151109_B4]